MIALILVDGYWKVVAAFRRDPAIGGLWLAYLIAAAFYSITEAGFRLIGPIWIFLLLAIVYSSGIASGAIGGSAETPAESIGLRNIQSDPKQRLELLAPVRRAT
jgi:hypothetical protein